MPYKQFCKWLAITLIASNALILVLHLCIYKWHWLPQKFLWVMVDLTSESNVPTWFASILWFLVSAAALGGYVLERKKARFAFLWLGIALVFLVASVDEVATVHEEMGTYLQVETEEEGLDKVIVQTAPGSPWILFYAPVLLAGGIICGAFLWRRFSGLPRGRVLLVLAVECYFIAVGLDYYQGLKYSKRNEIAHMLNLENPQFVEATRTIEEVLENAGTSLLLFAFTSYVLQAVRQGAREPEGS